MPSVFENLSEKFYTAFLEPQPEARKTAVEQWVKEATPIVQASVEAEIRAFADMVLNNGKEEPAWKNMAEKFSHYAERDKVLFLEFTIGSPRRPRILAEKLSPEVRSRTIDTARKLFPQSFPAPVAPPQPKANTVQSDDDSDDGGSDDGRSPNDDRSDSMNPNNDSYQASMDNHSNQMNPNNDAYWSSRGR